MNITPCIEAKEILLKFAYADFLQPNPKGWWDSISEVTECPTNIHLVHEVMPELMSVFPLVQSLPSIEKCNTQSAVLD
jgi:hypothetical protein